MAYLKISDDLSRLSSSQEEIMHSTLICDNSNNDSYEDHTQDKFNLTGLSEQVPGPTVPPASLCAGFIVSKSIQWPTSSSSKSTAASGTQSK
uniref:Uncharacterized protein n=1 Tax=Equus asinus asinus TaxID=83772 RepID=A0A8C4PJP6_EQUAS